MALPIRGVSTAASIRIQNLEELIRKAGTLDKVAQVAGSSAVYLSQVRTGAIDVSTGRRRELGTRMARRLETAFEKPEGWMDTDHAICATAQSSSWPFALLTAEEVQQLTPARMDRLDKQVRDRLDEWAETTTPGASRAPAAAQGDELAHMLQDIADPVERERRYAIAMAVLVGTPPRSKAPAAAIATLDIAAAPAPMPAPIARR